MAKNMTREDFEEWLEEHREEALGRIDVLHTSCASWIRLYSRALQAELDEEGHEAQPDEDDDDDALSFMMDEED